MTSYRVAATVAAAIVAALLGWAGVARAGGPLAIQDDGTPYLWSTATPIAYRTDQGPLSAAVNETQARARVISAFSVWQDVPTSSIRYERAGFINPTGAFTGGDVDTILEFDAVVASCEAGLQSPIIYDADGSIFAALGFDQESIIGFAGPCAVNATEIVRGMAMMNGRFQDGQGVDLPAAAFDAALIHELGHFSGLDHSQINLACLFGPCGSDLDGLPTMFPLLLDVAQGSLATDDIAWISRLYPETAAAPTFTGTHGTITGIVYFRDGESHVQFANVVARRVNEGGNEDRRIVASVISGYKFRMFHGNPITNPAPSMGSEHPGDIGLFEIPVPAGDYIIEIESIWQQFTGGSSVGPGFIIPLTSSAPPAGPVHVAAGATVSVDLVLNHSPPRFDSFETP
ncbi:MAG: hypothetical protein KF822_05710 [Steroidobacteraceae bacterium]|nr:hypothetical protein [Steroidobacteraceae bacterium]